MILWFVIILDLAKSSNEIFTITVYVFFTGTSQCHSYMLFKSMLMIIKLIRLKVEYLKRNKYITVHIVIMLYASLIILFLFIFCSSCLFMCLSNYATCSMNSTDQYLLKIRYENSLSKSFSITNLSCVMCIIIWYAFIFTHRQN